MTNETSTTRSGAASWVAVLAGLAGAAVLFGVRDASAVEVFGFEVSVLLVGLVLFFLGFLGGIFNRRRG